MDAERDCSRRVASRSIAFGAHFFDLLAEDVVFDDVITVPGYPAISKDAKPYRPYGTTFFLDRCYDRAVHHDRPPASSCSSTPHKAGSFRPELLTPTGTSRCSRLLMGR